MEELTVNDLKRYQSLANECKLLQLQIEDTYAHVTSPTFDTVGSTCYCSGDPTARAVNAIEKMRSQIATKESEMLKIEQRIETINDAEVRLICFNHFILGWTWRATCEHVRNHSSDGTIRRKVFEYFERGK